MRLVTKINIYFGIILTLLMLACFAFTQRFFHQELESQLEDSLKVTHASFKMTINTILNEEKNKAANQLKRAVIGLATKDRLNSVLYYYLNRAAEDYSIDLLEVLDRKGNLLADNHQSYALLNPHELLHTKPKPASFTSYLTQRQNQVYLVSTTQILYDARIVGYLSIGTQVNRRLVNYFTSVLHSQTGFFADTHKLVGSADFQTFPSAVLKKLQTQPHSTVFLPGNQVGVGNYDYILFTLPTDGQFTGVVALAKSRSGIQRAMLRLQLFLFLLTGFGLTFGIIGTHSLARNIKKSIFGMEPQEIASLLDQRTTILQSTFEGIIALDQTGRLLLINQAAQRFLPASCQAIGQPANHFFDDLRFQEVLQTGQAVYNQQQVFGESIIVYNCVPVKTKNRTLGAVITFRDLTEFQKVAAELMEVKIYTQALRAQSHEFMNKMQSVSGLIQLGRYETALTLLHETTESHQEIISFLASSFAHSAVSGILLGKFNRAKELNINFEINRRSHLPRHILVPDHELVCIVGNLIENAFEALQTQNLTPKNVHVRLRPVNRYFQIVIVDNGPGIPSAIRTMIFERGFTSKKGQNKGIGLSLVKQCVENLQGSIRVHSTLNTTIFWVKIPFKDGGQCFECN